jgi:putative Ca2+/H+ antiporter (TMEM165/GDT1 family)
MDALVPAFVAALLAGWGEKTQLIVAALSARSGRPGLVLAGLAVAAAASSALAAWAGTLIAATITIRAMTLMTALALLFAGIAGFIPRKANEGETRTPPVLAAFILCLAAETGDRVQFLTFALAGRFDTPVLAAAGATAGLVLACAPAAMLGADFGRVVPLRIVRPALAILFLVAGFIVGVNALRLV